MADRDYFLWKVATKKPSLRYEQERNFVELFRRAAIEKEIIERNMKFFSQRLSDGAGI